MELTLLDGSSIQFEIELDVDSDDDELPDDYEIAQFGSIEFTTGFVDSDGDLVSNVDEWKEGTSPISNTDFRPRLDLFSLGGMILPDPVQDSYALNDLVSLTALPFDGRGFYGWYGLSISNVSPDSPITITMDDHKTVSANFNYHGVVAWGRNDSGETFVPDSLRSVVSITGGDDHALALHLDGSVSGWGSTSSSRLAIPVLTDAIAVSAGGAHSVALQSDGTMASWGTSSYDLDEVPSGFIDVASVVCGEQYNLVLFQDGTVSGWGRNSNGQLSIPVGLNTVVQVVAGDEHSIALRADGELYLWGDNTYGELDVPGYTGRIVKLVAGADHNLALLDDGSVIAWGRDNYGQATVPEGLSNIVDIAAGRFYSMALQSDGTVVAWGYNAYGQVGGVLALPRVVKLDGGEYYGVALGELEVLTDLPVILCDPILLGAVDAPFYKTVVARNSPYAFGATGLPNGLSIDMATGKITGTPTESGRFPVTLTATNAAGSSEHDVELIINLPLPLIDSVLASDVYMGFGSSFQVTTAHGATTFAAIGLPDGLNINEDTGEITGVPLESGVFSVEVTATNAYGSDIKTVVFTSFDTPTPLENAATATGALEVDAIDVWSFSGDAGDPVKVRVAADVTSLDLILQIYSTSGQLIGTTSSNRYDQFLGFVLPETGSYLLRVSSYFDGRSGGYSVNYSNAGQPFTIQDGDDGGALANGLFGIGGLPLGDIDMWTLNAAAGDDIVVRAASQQNSNDDLRMRIYSPSGALVWENTLNRWDLGARFITTEAGDYVVQLDMYSNERSSALYHIHLANVDQPFAIPLDDQGGALSNGPASEGVLSRGDIDLWTFSASAGDNISLRTASMNGTSYDLQMRVFAPSGALVSEETSARWDVHAGFVAAETGDYVVRLQAYYVEDISDLYRINISNSGATISGAAGDEDAVFSFGSTVNGSIVRGDMDSWQFDANSGDRISLSATSSGMRIWLRLLDPEQNQIAIISNTTSGSFSPILPMDGQYTLRMQSWYVEDDGTYSMAVNRESAPVLESIGDQEIESGETLNFTASASDPDSGPQAVVYSLIGAPEGASIGASSGVFTWTPSVDQVGETYTFTVGATDGDLTDSEVISVTVLRVIDFDAWIDANVPASIPPSLRVPSGDIDLDGVTNLEELAFNMNPNSPDLYTLMPTLGTSGLPYYTTQIESDLLYLSMEFVRRRNVANLDYIVEIASDLDGSGDSWEVLEASIEVVEVIDDEWERVTIRDWKSSPPETKRFGRIRLEYEP
ncbi:MAG: putative Ig domain-containing protein [Verrucomicrobiota bacterium]